MLVCACYCDVEDIAKIVEGLLEGYIAEVVLQKGFEHIDVHKVAGFGNPLELLPQRKLLLINKRLKIHLAAIKKLFLMSRRNQSSNHTARTTTSNNNRHAVSLHQSLYNANMIHA